MEVKVPYLIQDPLAGAAKFGGAGGSVTVERHTFGREGFCLDGPVSRRVAILDFDPETGELAPGVTFVPGATPDDPGTYAVDDEDHESPGFLAVNCFATVMATLYMFEEADALGREIEWAFDSPQLLVVPRAGELTNAFYQRESKSLQFFFFPQRRRGGGTVFTALSQDIIAHETAHAILDGIAPELYDSLTPQSLAIHEAVADLTALLSALRSNKLRKAVLDDTGGSISGQTAYTRVAEQFASARDHSGKSLHLRSLWNRRTLDPDDTSLDERNRANRANRGEPHMLSEVLSGALYGVLVELHDDYKRRRVRTEGCTEYEASGWALWVASEHFKRLILRALDYLPPGEVSFADYGRAIVGSDQASDPRDSIGRDVLVKNFVHRHIATRDEMTVETNLEIPEIADLDLDAFAAGDWVGYRFVEDHRDIFAIPEGVSFRLHPRLKATKEYYSPTERQRVPVTECIVKVSWNRTEPNPRGFPVASLRQITVGSTLVIDWKTQVVRVRLISDAASTPDDAGADSPGGRLRADRDLMLANLVAIDGLLPGTESGDEAQFNGGARVQVSGDVMRIVGSGRMLHIAAGLDADYDAQNYEQP